MIRHTGRRAVVALAGLLLAAGAASAQTVTLARDAGDGTRQLVTLDSTDGALLAVRPGAELLAPRLAGRARLRRLRADLPNLVSVGDGAARLRLPTRRSVFLIAVDGVTELLRVDGLAPPVTLLDAVAAGGPLQPWIAARDDGRLLLAATTSDRVWALDPHTLAPPVELTPAVPVPGVAGESLRLGADTAWMVADGRLLRADLLAADPRFAPVPDALGADETLLPELAVSADGRCVAAVSELPGGARRLHVAAAGGALAPVVDRTGDFDLPSLSDPAGPFLALSRDGGFVAWRETLLVKEVFTRRVETSADPLQVTADANVADTFDGSGILDFTAEGQLVVGVGELDPTKAATLLDRADVLRLDLTTPGAPLQNVSATSGETMPPYDQGGVLEIRDALQSPDGAHLLLEVDPDNGDAALSAVTPALLDSLQSLVSPSEVDLTFRPGGPSVLVVRQPLGPFPAQLDVVRADLSVASVAAPQAVTALDRFTLDPRGLRAALVVDLGALGEVPLLVQTSTGALALGAPIVPAVSEAIGLTPALQLVVGLGTPPRWGLFAPGNPPLKLDLLPGDAIPLQP